MPRPRCGFIGRDHDLTALVDLLGRSRLVTLAGPPGAGKTRLAIELARRVGPRHNAGMTFVELAPVADPLFAAAAVGAALRLHDRPDRSDQETVVEALARDATLLVLDNCDHVVDSMADLVGDLLRRCPALCVLATSRSPLRLHGEQVWRVEPLDLTAASQLFRYRAGPAALHPGDQDDDVVAQICRRVDGLPLAIELAAASTPVLAPADVLERLEHALPLPPDGARGRGPRPQTMEATIDWSYERLDRPVKHLFERLSVFRGGFDLDAANAIARDRDVLPTLAVLVDQSLVLATPGPGQVTRYRLLEPIRQFALARLARRGDEDGARRSHAEHYLEVARRADHDLRSNAPGAVLATLEEDEGNFRVALDWALREPGDLGLRLATALSTGWAIRGRVNEGRAWIKQALERPGSTDDPALRLSALARASRLTWRQLDYRATRALLEESIILGRKLDDELAVARRLRALAMVAVAEGDLKEAEELGRQCIATFRAHEDWYGLSLAAAFMGLTLQLAGQCTRAESYIREALDLTQSHGNVTSALYALGGLAIGAIAAGDFAELRRLLTEIIRLLDALGEKYEDPSWLWWMACALASGERRFSSALRLAGASEAFVGRHGSYLHQRMQRPVQPWLDRARAYVSPARAKELTAQGAGLTIAELLEEALSPSDHGSDGPLSARELEIAELIARGLTNSEIAERLFISRRTVEGHVDHIKAKLNVQRRAGIVAWCYRRKSA